MLAALSFPPIPTAITKHNNLIPQYAPLSPNTPDSFTPTLRFGKTNVELPDDIQVSTTSLTKQDISDAWRATYQMGKELYEEKFDFKGALSSKGAEEDFVTRKMSLRDYLSDGYYNWLLKDDKGIVSYASLSPTEHYAGEFQNSDTGKFMLKYVRKDRLGEGIEQWITDTVIEKAKNFNFKKLINWSPWYAYHNTGNLVRNGFTLIPMPDHESKESTRCYFRTLGYEG